jgi:alkylhydroperoxidase family enzyme
MPRIAPIALEDLEPELAGMLASGRDSRMLSSTLPIQIWGHRPAAAKAWLRTLEQFHLHGCLDDRLRELVRLKIASITKCNACQIARKSDAVSEADIACLTWDDPRFSPREQAALRYAELFAADHFALDETVFEQLERHYTVEEIVELNMFSALMLAGGRMTYVQRGYPEEKDVEA